MVTTIVVEVGALEEAAELAKVSPELTEMSEPNDVVVRTAVLRLAEEV